MSSDVHNIQTAFNVLMKLISLVNPAGSQDKIEVHSSSLHGLHIAWELGGFIQLISC
jgi:hypothetical protein